VDSVYFSFANITTAACGDIHPVAGAAKLLTNLDVLLGLALVVLGVGRYFAGASAEA
jgi:hypothetical protein